MYQLVIVDDEDKIVEGIANLFPWEQLGFQVTWFSRPLKALEYVRQHKVDVLMSDIEMPEMNGLELCRQLQDTDIKIVFISSHQNYEYFRYAIQYRVEDYLLKPIKSGDILNVDLDNTAGYMSSFLDEAFGNLIYDFGKNIVEQHLHIISNQEQDWIEMLQNESYPQWEQRRLKKEKPKKTVSHDEWFRLEENVLKCQIW